MESKYDLSPLPAPLDSHLGLQLFRATRRSRPGAPLFVKRYNCPNLVQVDSLVKTALTQARAEGGLQLLEVVPIEEETKRYTVSFVYRMEGEVSEEVLYRNDGHHTHRPFLEGYNLKQQIRKKNDLYTLAVAWSDVSNREVILKESCHYVMRKLRPQIAKALIHARLQHANVRRILDIAVCERHPGYAVVLLFEKFQTDLKTEIAKRVSLQPYSETELWKLLRDVGQALAYIHGQVKTRQQVAHCNVKPSKVLQDTDGHYRLGGFGLAVADAALAQCVDGTVAFMSVEAKAALVSGQLYDPYKGDVFALGATLLCAAGLREVPFGEAQSQEMEAEVLALPYSEEFKRVLSWMLGFNPNDRPNISDICASL